MRGRAFNRAQTEKKKAWAAKILESRNYHRPMDGVDIGRAATTPAPCSCPMCGNPRKHFGNSNPLKVSEIRRIPLLEG